MSAEDTTTHLRTGQTVERIERSGMRPDITRWYVSFALGGIVKGYQLNTKGERVGTRREIKGGFMVSFRILPDRPVPPKAR